MTCGKWALGCLKLTTASPCSSPSQGQYTVAGWAVSSTLRWISTVCFFFGTHRFCFVLVLLLCCCCFCPKGVKLTHDTFFAFSSFRSAVHIFNYLSRKVVHSMWKSFPSFSGRIGFVIQGATPLCALRGEPGGEDGRGDNVRRQIAACALSTQMSRLSLLAALCLVCLTGITRRNPRLCGRRRLRPPWLGDFCSSLKDNNNIKPYCLIGESGGDDGENAATPRCRCRWLAVIGLQ